MNTPSSALEQCPRYGACEVGGTRGYELRCAEGHFGPLCAACQRGFVPLDNSPCAPCVTCDASQDVLVILFALAVVAAVLGLVVLSVVAIKQRGSLQQDLLIGALRIAAGYFAIIGYISIALQPVTEQDLGLSSRAVTLPQWQSACGRVPQFHQDTVRGSAALGNYSAFADNPGTWHSDAGVFTARSQTAGESDASWAAGIMGDVFAFMATATGALPVTAFAEASCTLGHHSFVDQTLGILGASTALLFVSAALVGAVEFMGADGRRCPAPLRRCLVPKLTRPRASSPPMSMHRNPLAASPAGVALPGPGRASTRALAKPADASTASQSGSSAKSKPNTSLWEALRATPPLIILWAMTRTAASVYILAWGATLGSSLQALAPGYEVDAATHIFAASLGASSQDGLLAFAYIAFSVHAIAFPLLAMWLLRAQAPHLVDKSHHASVTYAVMTAGYRLQLSPSQAEHAARKFVEEEAAHGKGIPAEKDAERMAGQVVVRLSVRMSRQMEQRCCGLAKWIPSHGFALLRMMQNMLVLCALWLTTASPARVAVIAVTVVAMLLLTYALQPYALQELNILDAQVCLTALVHLLILYSARDSTPAMATLLVLHCIMVLSLVWAIARGFFKKARGVGAALRARLAGVLPDLAPDCDVQGDAEELAASSIGVLDVLRAAGVKAGLLAPRARPSPSGGRWTAALASSLSMVRAELSSKHSPATIESKLVTHAASALALSPTVFDSLLARAALCTRCGKPIPRTSSDSISATLAMARRQNTAGLVAALAKRGRLTRTSELPKDRVYTETPQRTAVQRSLRKLFGGAGLAGSDAAVAKREAMLLPSLSQRRVRGSRGKEAARSLAAQARANPMLVRRISGPASRPATHAAWVLPPHALPGGTNAQRGTTQTSVLTASTHGTHHLRQHRPSAAKDAFRRPKASKRSSARELGRPAGRSRAGSTAGRSRARSTAAGSTAMAPARSSARSERLKRPGLFL